MTVTIGRRELLAALGGAAVAWPLVARAQQAAMPVVGVLGGASLDALAELRAFRQGLKEVGYVEGENVAVEYRSADNRIDRLPELAADLLRRRVAVIAAADMASTRAAQAATTTIPIVFLVGADPVSRGLVASLARPGGNATGINVFTGELVAKRLGLLRELVPGATRVAALVHSADADADSTSRDVEATARAMGLQIQVFKPSTSREISAAFAIFMRERPDALFVGPGPFFNTRRVQLVLLAATNKIPTIYGVRSYVEAGGLMSYGASLADAFRQVGIYTGRILKGEKPADLPVLQPTKFEFVINAETARMLGVTVPDKLLALADEVIE